MKIQAAIFDVYGTLLEVQSAPPTGEAGWKRLWNETLGIEPSLTRLDFSINCNRLIREQHEIARARGILHPEILWPVIVRGAVPGFASLSKERQQEFISGHMRTVHKTWMSQEAAETLRRLKRKNCVLGIASNAQAYTLCELADALAQHRLAMELFDPAVCFWSFQHGFSKPDLAVFQVLSIRLEARGIPRDQILAVGDRLDNDIAPARSHGWQTWHLSAPPVVDSGSGGGWNELLAAIG